MSGTFLSAISLKFPFSSIGSIGALYNVLPENHVIYTSSSGVCGTSSEFTVNETTFKVKAMTNEGKYWANKTFYWIAIAE